MLKKFCNTPIRFAAMLSLVLVVAISAAWAVQYSNSKVICMGGGDNIKLAPSPDRVFLHVPPGSLDAYLAEKGLNSVKITAQMTEEWVQSSSGGYYNLTFVFGPSGTYFDPNNPAELKLNGKYVNANFHLCLYDEDGEAIEGTLKVEDDKIIFETHFSNYYYDHYY